MFALVRPRYATKLYADSDWDDWPTPAEEAADMGTGTANVWPNFAGSFQVNVSMD